jgi:hypothetical protein
MTMSIAAHVRRLRDERGTTLIETTIACGILLVTMAGLMSMGTIATMHTENQGHLAPRTAEYAQDKMEQLLALAYTDQFSDTVAFPAVESGGAGLSIGGSTNTAAPVNGYVDWLANDGSLLGGGAAAPAKWFTSGCAGDLRFRRVQQQPAVGNQTDRRHDHRAVVGGGVHAGQVNRRRAESLAVLTS